MPGKKQPRASPNALREFKTGAGKASAFQILQARHLFLPTRRRLIPTLVQTPYAMRIAANLSNAKY
jgi:hypothetical protein